VQISALARGLPAELFRVTVVCLYPRGPLLAELKAADVAIVSLEKKGRWDLVSFIPKMIWTLGKLKPDILLSFLAPPNILSCLASPFLRQCPVILGIRASNMDLSNYDWTWRLTHKAEQILARLAQVIVANSQSGKEFSLTQGFPDKFKVIANGIDLDRFRPSSRDRQELRKEWGLSDDTTVIGLAARLDPMKDHDTFIKAAAILANSCSDVRFVCVGEGNPDFVAALKENAKTAGLGGRIIWAGTRHDMCRVYNAFDIATLTSSYGEGFPNTIGEAMACGKRCVVTNVGDAAFVVGSTGLITAVRDAREIANAWLELLGQTKTQRLTGEEKSRSRIVDNFSVPAMVDAYSELFLKYAQFNTND
jgi:glycosyltransferase involved in cell wall biosynthesis